MNRIFVIIFRSTEHDFCLTSMESNDLIIDEIIAVFLSSNSNQNDFEVDFLLLKFFVVKVIF